MIIQLKKFGTTLTSRPAGREAFNAIRNQIAKGESVQLDFSDVLAVTPSWVDEFLTLILEQTENNVDILSTENASVLATMRILHEAGQEPVAEVAGRFLNAPA